MNIEFQIPQEPDVSMRSLSSSSSSSTSSSSSAASSCSASIVSSAFSPVQTEHHGTGPTHNRIQLRENGEVSMAKSDIEGLVSPIDIMGNGGMEWKDVEERFNLLASNENNGFEAEVKWSDFGFCIGENH